MLVYLQAWNLRCCVALSESWASMARPLFCSLCSAGANRSFFVLQITQPSSVLQRCFFVDLLQSCNVVTLAVTTLLDAFASCGFASVLHAASCSRRGPTSTGTHKARGIAALLFRITGHPFVRYRSRWHAWRCAKTAALLLDPKSAAQPTMADNDEQVAKNLLVYAADKGTQDVDRQKINAIILEMSGDSKYTNEKKEKRDNSQEWIATARKKLATFDATQRSVARHHLAKAEARFEKRRHELDAAGTCCAVVDFDMFYAAVEIRDRPELKDKPVAVGGIGMISTANYVARKWGVRSAMPGFIGQALCRRGPEFGMPKTELVFVSPVARRRPMAYCSNNASIHTGLRQVRTSRGHRAGYLRSIRPAFQGLLGRRSVHRPDALPAVPRGLRRSRIGASHARRRGAGERRVTARRGSRGGATRRGARART